MVTLKENNQLTNVSIFSSILLDDYSPTHQKATHQQTAMMSQFLSMLSKVQFMDFVRAQESRKEKGTSR